VTSRVLALALLLACPWVVHGQSKAPLRVCSDPENMPFSNQKLEGFENRIASLIAKDMGTTVSYIWWGQRRGFIRNTMNATLQEGRCDVVIGVPEGYDLVSTTPPYYRSTYVFVYPKGKGLAVKSLERQGESIVPLDLGIEVDLARKDLRERHGQVGALARRAHRREQR